MKKPADPGKKGAFKALAELFETVHGWLTLIPGLIVAVDFFADFLPISTALKPLVYILTILLITFSVFSHAYRYANVPPDAAAVQSLPRKAAWVFAFSIAIAGVYWIAVDSSDSWMPQTPVLRSTVLFGLAFLVALFFERVTRSILMLAWKRHVSLDRK